MNEAKINKARILRTIVERVFGVDIMQKKRTRILVDARIIYSKILRENGYSFPIIGALLAKNHTTILHYCSMYDEDADFIPELKGKYLLCKSIFNGELPGEYNYTKDELISELLNVKKQLSLLHLKCEELENYKRQKENE
jgi:hypothetical protein